MDHDVNCVHSDELPDLIQALATLFSPQGVLIIETLLIFCGLNKSALARYNPLLNIALRHYLKRLKLNLWRIRAKMRHIGSFAMIRNHWLPVNKEEW